jgi:hypothetical protein
MVAIPLDSVSFRDGAVPAREVAVVVEDVATKRNAKASGSAGVGLDLETVLSVQACVRGAGEPQHCWIDLHVFDDCDRVIRSETLPLAHLRPAEDGGELYGLEGTVYRGTGASPGSVWLAPDARKLQYRLYCEEGGAVYSDGVLRQHDLPADSDLTNSGTPPSRRKRAATR